MVNWCLLAPQERDAEVRVSCMNRFDRHTDQAQVSGQDRLDRHTEQREVGGGTERITGL